MTESQPPIRVLVADDNPVVRSGLISLLEASGEVEIVGEAENGQHAIDLAGRVSPDLILLDVRMPVLDGVQAVATLSKEHLVVMLTYTEEPDIVREAVRNGASGYLVHGTFTTDELGTYIRSAIEGRNPLSPQAAAAVLDAVRASDPAADTTDDTTTRTQDVLDAGLTRREVEVMEQITKGLSNKDIAGELFVSEKTVKNNVNRIFTKLQVTSRAAAIARWIGTDEPSKR